MSTNQTQSKRYEMFSRPKSAPSMDDEETYKASKEYATFLKETERKCGPDGFLDSRRYTHAFELNKNKQQQARTARSGRPETPRTIDVSLDRQRYEQDYEKRIKAIEDAMWQAKQEERHLERSKRDVMKKQRDVRQMMKSWEQKVTKESFDEDKKLSKSLEKYTTLQRNFSRRKIDNTKKRGDQLSAMISERHNVGRKAQLSTSHLSREYRDKMDKLQLSRLEADTLVKDFEAKLRRKEMEQISLKRELEELSDKYYREVLKGKTVTDNMNSDLKSFRQNNIKDDRQTEQKMETQLARGDGDVKAADMRKRRLSAQLSTTRGRIAIKKREEDRTLQSTRIKLNDNVEFQRKLNVDAAYANSERKTREQQQKIEEANVRRINAANTQLHSRKAERENRESVFSERAHERQRDMQRLQHEDSLRHLRRCVSHGEGLEMQLHARVKNAEYLRLKHEKEARRLQQQLSTVKKTNARRLTCQIADANRLEKELTEQIIRVRAELDKAHADREQSYYALQSHRSRLHEDKQMLETTRASDKRLPSIGQRSDGIVAQ